jgi:hypothetical protein
MAHSYTPGLKVTDSYIVRKRRILPLDGKVLVQVGQSVSPEDIVAKTELPGDAVLENVASRLGLPPEEVPECMIKKEGEHVEKDEIIASAKSFFGLFKSTAKASRPGTIESINKTTGQVLLRGAPIPVQVHAYVNGKVVEVEEGQGCVVQTHAAFVQGIFGIGGETNGNLRTVCMDPNQVLSKDLIKPDMAGQVIIGGSLVTADALKEAIKVGAAGVVAGGFNDKDLKAFLGYDLGVAITGQEELGITLIVTEGFGEIGMAQKTYDLLNAHEGQLACINGATQIRAGVIRPEVVIPLAGAENEKAKTTDEIKGLEIGTQIRVIRSPYFGMLGTVSGLPTEPHALESGSKARVLEVKLVKTGENAIVPRANVELIED